MRKHRKAKDFFKKFFTVRYYINLWFDFTVIFFELFRLPHGCSRFVIFFGKYALKVAYSFDGISDNKNELFLYKKFKIRKNVRKFFPKLYTSFGSYILVYERLDTKSPEFNTKISFESEIVKRKIFKLFNNVRFPEQIVPHDLHRGNFALKGDQLVVIDFGHFST